MRIMRFELNYIIIYKLIICKLYVAFNIRGGYIFVTQTALIIRVGIVSVFTIVWWTADETSSLVWTRLAVHFTIRVRASRQDPPLADNQIRF